MQKDIGAGPITSTASNPTPAFTGGQFWYSELHITALAAAMTAQSLAVTPRHSERFLLTIKDNGTARAFTWTSSVITFADGVTAPTTSVVGKTHAFIMRYDSVAARLIVMGHLTY